MYVQVFFYIVRECSKQKWPHGLITIYGCFYVDPYLKKIYSPSVIYTDSHKHVIYGYSTIC